MLFRSNDTATTEIYTQAYTLSLHDALPIFIDVHSRRLGDLVAGTLVVYAGAAGKQSAAPNVPVVDPPPGLALGERAAIVEFAERAAQLTPERQQELAALLPMLTHGHGALAVQRLHGMAGALLGRR